MPGDRLAVPRDTAPMEARLTAALPEDGGWQFEPKWDGFRCLAFKDAGEVELRAKSGKSLSRYFPEVVARLATHGARRFVVDGELMIQVGGAHAFEALQMRLHPARSRVRRLASENPAALMLFDCLAAEDGTSLMAEPLTRRREALEALHDQAGAAAGLHLTPYSRERGQAQAWLDHLQASLDGVICKRLDGPYLSGERAMLKIKVMRTADCVVGGFRYQAGGRQVASLLLGLYNEAGRLDHVGFTSSIADKDRAALTARLERLAGPPGFTGEAPGGPSRWSTQRTGEWVPLKPELVVEVRYDHVSGGRFRHGTRLIRWRPEKAPRQCRMEQIATLPLMEGWREAPGGRVKLPQRQ